MPIGWFVDIQVTVKDELLGINLQSQRNNCGAFIESFYRSNEGLLYEVERTGEVFVGDVVYSVEGELIEPHCGLHNIHARLLSSARPMTVVFRRYKLDTMSIHLTDDSRVGEWLYMFLSLYFTVEDADQWKQKIYSKAVVDVIIDCKGLWSSATLSSSTMKTDSVVLQQLICILSPCIEYCMSRYDIKVLPIEFMQLSENMLSESIDIHALMTSLSAVSSWLQSDIDKHLICKFEHCITRKQCTGWIANSQPFCAVTMSDIFQNTLLSACYYIFLHSIRRYIDPFVNILLFHASCDMCHALQTSEVPEILEFEG